MIDLRTAPYGIFLLRLTTGALFVSHGMTKMFVFTPAGTAGYFQSLGLPGWLGIATMTFEIVGGLALIFGIWSRLVSVVAVPVLLGAALTAHLPNGFGWSNAGGGWEYPVMWAAVQAGLALLGDGAFALLPFRLRRGEPQLA
ncbi:DoxX family protein [Tropicimonas sp. IMCC34043]|uniref:DoxX family protein n=1 Tax=Tropicimonas sp. IMCC34043 TaxID=2248760 RepID=UPI000E277FB3|nr:DoxX family protein [Tropicimonas sp. IMCC34043]